MIYLVLIILTFPINSFSAEIIQDQQGNYYIMKKDGTFTKLPAPKAGQTGGPGYPVDIGARAARAHLTATREISSILKFSRISHVSRPRG